jgi:hypothetical protein
VVQAKPTADKPKKQPVLRQRQQLQAELEGVGEKKLQSLTHAQLKDECKCRDITGFSSFGKGACISALLKWKESKKRKQAPKPSSGAHT